MKTRGRTRLVFGAMTGTSADAVDVAAVRVRGRGLRVRGELLETATAPLGELALRIRDAQRQVPMPAGDFACLARDIALAHRAPMIDLASRHGAPDLVVVHGQTLFHDPPVSLQLIDPFPLAQALGCPVMCGLRGADLAAGGQGAPITPLADWMIFRRRGSPRAVINLGGFVNATIVPAGPGTDAEWIAGVRGFDICLCNQWLDHLARTRAGANFDDGGRLASAGRPDDALTESLAARLAQQRAAGRSLGTAHETAAELSAPLAPLSPQDALATAVRVIARAIALALDADWPHATRGRGSLILVAGGGARNATLARAITTACRTTTATTETVGVGVDAREALAMAVLGAAAHDGADITLRAVTGRGDLRCGSALAIAPRVNFTQSSRAAGRESGAVSDNARPARP